MQSILGLLLVPGRIKMEILKTVLPALGVLTFAAGVCQVVEVLVVLAVVVTAAVVAEVMAVQYEYLGVNV
jgi:hypothetical protein